MLMIQKEGVSFSAVCSVPLCLPSVFLYHSAGASSFDMGGFLMFACGALLGFYNFYRANFRMNESELEKEKEEEKNKEWEDKKW
jgi:hypothetical protein